jgi:MFS family permease
VIGRLAFAAPLFGPTLPVLAVVFSVTVGMGMVWSILAVYAQSLSGSAAWVGGLVAAYGGARLVASLPAGVAAQRWGTRRVMASGLVVLALGSVAAAGTSGVVALFACMVVQGLGYAGYVTGALAAIAERGSADSRVRDMAGFQAAAMIALSVGPGLGGFAVALWGYAAPFLLQGLAAGAGMVALRWVRPPEAARVQVRPASAPMEPRLLARVAVLGLMTYSVYFTRIGANWVLLPLIASQQFQAGIGLVGAMLTAGAVANLAALPLTAWLARRVGRLPVIILATAVNVLGLALLAVAHDLAPIWAGAVLMGGSGGIAAPTLSAYAADAAPAGRQGAAMGLLRTISDVGVVTGPVVVGGLVDAGFGHRGALVFCIGLLLVGTLLFVLQARRRS